MADQRESLDDMETPQAADELTESLDSPESPKTRSGSSKLNHAPKRKFLGLDRDRVKIVLGTLIVIGVIAFILQNWTYTSITFIWTLTLPRWLLYSGLSLAGLLLGWILKGFSIRSKKKAQ